MWRFKGSLSRKANHIIVGRFRVRERGRLDWLPCLPSVVWSRSRKPCGSFRDRICLSRARYGLDTACGGIAGRRPRCRRLCACGRLCSSRRPLAGRLGRGWLAGRRRPCAGRGRGLFARNGFDAACGRIARRWCCRGFCACGRFCSGWRLLAGRLRCRRLSGGRWLLARRLGLRQHYCVALLSFRKPFGPGGCQAHEQRERRPSDQPIAAWHSSLL
jgi:hypothetical protein